LSKFGPTFQNVVGQCVTCYEKMTIMTNDWNGDICTWRRLWIYMVM